MSSRGSVMEKITSLIIGLFISVLIITLINAASLATTTKILYAHSEGGTLGGGAYKLLKTTACDGPQAKIELESAASGIVSLGNSSIIQLSSIEPYMTKLKKGTWTITYYAVANVSDKATLLCTISLVYSNGTVKETLGNNVAETTALSTSNSSLTGTFSLTSDKPIINPSNTYIKIDWKANKTDTTALKITLWLDVASNPTKVSEVKYEYNAVTGTTVGTLLQLAIMMSVLAIGLLAIGSVMEKRKR